MRILAVLLSITFLFSGFTVEAASRATEFKTTLTPEELIAKYEAAGNGGEKVKILVMPGHEPAYGGALYLTLKERDIAVQIGEKLAELLEANPRYEVTVARDATSWTPELTGYFKRQWKKITTFVAEHKEEMARLVRRGHIEDRDFEVPHNTAATDVALRLYGINKWANEQDYDIAIHIHLNDAVDHTATTPGNHSGFAVYVPDSQYGNAQASKAVGQAIAFELNHFNASSTLPIENYAIVEDQDLIALGAFNTAEFASVLIEYAYIYESKIVHTEARTTVLNDMAYQTYRGLQDFFEAPVVGDDTLALPYAWTVSEIKTGVSSPQIYALQVALHTLGFYPPKGELLIGCPISGFAGPCTVSALKQFQASKGLEQTGSLGPKTVAALKAAGF